MGFNFGGEYFDTVTGMGDISLGAADASPLPDVSWSAPAEQPYTPTGNGSGYFIDTNTQNAIFGSLDKVLNYAILRDQISMSRTPTPLQYAQVQTQQMQVRNNSMLLWIALGVGVVMLVNR